MKEIDIIEGNKLIAKFMGLVIRPKINGYSFIELNDMEVITEMDLEYHLDWNWLMPVIENIGSLSYLKPTINFKGINFNSNKIYVCSNINYTYLGVIHFIKWYNKQLN